MKKIAMLVPSEITQEAEAIEVVVSSTPADNYKCDQNNHSQTTTTTTTRNEVQDHEDLSKKWGN